MSLFPDPDAMLATASRIGAHADAMRLRADHLSGSMRAVHWHGIAANAFHAEADPIPTMLHTAAARLDDAAGALRRHAVRVQTAIDSLQRLSSTLLKTGVDVVHLLNDGMLHPQDLLDDAGNLLDDTGELLSGVGDVAGGVIAGAGDLVGSVGGLLGMG